MEIISFEEFKKIELRVAKIIMAERVEGSDKLLKLRVGLGGEERQIIAGIGKSYEPENLIGREIAVVANLEPRALMGLESQGMILCASDENGPVLVCPEKEVLSGTEIK
ncbi:MAG: methionine--tRNA ligase subunit beta [Candidatus Niyogibacteria bacterium]|nr:methionine--tRNA ligase subunit beta [Candidatus Niyogibacteria bacterium]